MHDQEVGDVRVRVEVVTDLLQKLALVTADSDCLPGVGVGARDERTADVILAVVDALTVCWVVSDFFTYNWIRIFNLVPGEVVDQSSLVALEGQHRHEI